jgi:hypothetical protein
MAAVYYLNCLQNSMPIFLQDIPLLMRLRMLFQHDGAPPHVGRKVTEYLHHHYPNCWTGHFGPFAWPARSHLTPLDYYLWEHMKDMVYPQKLQTREKLLQQIIESTNCIRGNCKIISKETNSFWDKQNCAYRMAEVILNSNQCNMTKN